MMNELLPEVGHRQVMPCVFVSSVCTFEKYHSAMGKTKTVAGFLPDNRFFM
jgi:hypothetical protein